MNVPGDYGSARDRFRAAADRLGCERHAYAVSARGPGGEELTIDVARRGDAGADRVVVVSSGLHGVEGFFGSAVQTAWLESLASAGERDRVQSGCAVVLLHTLNPWGFAHVRRTDDRNVDLNRNLLLPGEAYRGSPPLYAKLDPMLNPVGPPKRLDLFPLHAMSALWRYRRPAVAQAIAGGQYEFPRGLFFGGDGPAEVVAILRDALPRWLGNCSRMLHLDLHTGLGPWGTLRLLADEPLTPQEREMAGKLGAAAVVEPDQVPSGFYQTRGSLGSWCRGVFADRRYLCLVAEFGTYGGYSVVAALRRENQAHHYCAADDPRRLAAKRRLREVFCPASVAWRERSGRQAMQLIRMAMTAQMQV
jgi:hypothetical protein